MDTLDLFLEERETILTFFCCWDRWPVWTFREVHGYLDLFVEREINNLDFIVNIDSCVDKCSSIVNFSAAFTSCAALTQCFVLESAPNENSKRVPRRETIPPIGIRSDESVATPTVYATMVSLTRRVPSSWPLRWERAQQKETILSYRTNLAVESK